MMSQMPVRNFLFTSVFIALAGSASAGDSSVKFNRDIRPVMSDTCFHCHGPDKNSRKANLRLDLRDEALKPAKSGAVPIVPGKPEESEVIKRFFTPVADDLMPPEEAHKALTQEQKDLFKRWIAEGAKYEAHWAYTPLVRPPVPAVKQKDWVKSPIDAFILEKLEAAGVAPSPEASSTVLLRRLSLDLTGLPPEPGTAGGPVGEMAERLLKSPHFGERMAVWWLDVARFTDTVGFHGDQNLRNFPYRDYVIGAFNRNLPFDQFTREQLAGDLLPNPTPQQLVATGFNRLNMVTREGGAQPKEYIAKYGAERVRTVGGAWMGSTLGCCECHDHKFDPFLAKDFYSMQAYFADVKQWGVYSDYGYTPNPDLKGWSNEHPFPPEIQVESDYLKERRAGLRTRMAALAAGQENRAAAWTAASRAWLKENTTGWAASTPLVASSTASPKPKKGAPAKAARAAAKKAACDPAQDEKPEAATVAATVRPDGAIVFTAAATETNTLTFSPPAGWLATLRLDVLPDLARKGSILRSGAQGGATVNLKASLLRKDAKKETPLAIRYATATHKEPRYRNGNEVDDILGGWKTPAAAWNQPQTAVWCLDAPVELAAGDVVKVELADNALSSVRLSFSRFAVLDDTTNLASATAAGLESWLASTGADAAAFAEWKKLFAAMHECHGGKAWTVVTEARAPLTVRVLPRGNWMDETGPVVEPASPVFLTAGSPASATRRTRLDLANWLCSAENPLTGRAVMNRLWKQFFGTGLSAIVDDLGAQGEPPSHPELLDWLAVEFRESGWDMKHMIRLLVTSATYRQSSSLRPEMREIDPANRLLSSQNPRRLDAEFVRDNALAISGLLNPDMGGPSVKPYQPTGYYAALQFPDRPYDASPDDRQWRRGVYMHWQRTFLHPMLANFDAPMRDECTAARTNSNTPQQALTLLNDPAFVEAARAFATRLLKSTVKDDSSRIGLAYEHALFRRPDEQEITSLLSFLQTQRTAWKADPAAAEKMLKTGLTPLPPDTDTTELAAWTSLCRVILNLHETITRY